MIIVFGSLNLDMFLPVRRLPERGETVLTPSYSFAPGGKGANQCVAAAQALKAAASDMTVAMVGATGDDDWAAPATQILRDVGIDVSRIAALSHPTACASIWVEDGGENEIVVASGANAYVQADQVPDDLLTPDTWLVLQMEIPPQSNFDLIRRAQPRGAKVVLNVAPATPVPTDVLDMVDVLVLNEGEAQTVLSGETTDPTQQAKTLAARHNLFSVVTLGADGAVAATPDQEWRVAALPLEKVVDTTGAGDAFVGTLAAALALGHDHPTALRWASTGAGLACLTLGCQPAYAALRDLPARVSEVPKPASA